MTNTPAGIRRAAREMLRPAGVDSMAVSSLRHPMSAASHPALGFSPSWPPPHPSISRSRGRRLAQFAGEYES